MNNVRKQNSCRSPSIFSKCLSCQNFLWYTQSSLPLTSNSLNIVITYVVQIFAKKGRKNLTNCHIFFFFVFRPLFFFFEGAGYQDRIVKVAEFIFGQTKPHQQSLLTATIPARSLAMLFRISILC